MDIGDEVLVLGGAILEFAGEACPDLVRGPGTEVVGGAGAELMVGADTELVESLVRGPGAELVGVVNKYLVRRVGAGLVDGAGMELVGGAVSRLEGGTGVAGVALVDAVKALHFLAKIMLRSGSSVSTTES